MFKKLISEHFNDLQIKVDSKVNNKLYRLIELGV